MVLALSMTSSSVYITMAGAYISARTLQLALPPSETYNRATYAFQTAPLLIAAGEYVKVSDVLECSAIVCSQVFVVLASVTNKVTGALDDKKNVYNYVMEPILPMSSYQYVPTLVSMSTVGFSIAHTVMYGAIYGMLMYEMLEKICFQH